MKQSPCESTGKTDIKINKKIGLNYFLYFFPNKSKYTHHHLDHFDKNMIKVLTDLLTSCEIIQLIKSGLNWMSILHMCTNVTRHCKLVVEPTIRQSLSNSDWMKKIGT